VSMDKFLSPLTIAEWAYESTPGLPIEIGSVADNIRPVAILDAGLSETDNPVVMVHVTFSEPVQNLDLSDFVVSNGSITNWFTMAEGREYFAEVTAVNMGEVIFGLLHQSVSDYAGNLNVAAFTSWQFRVVAIPGHVTTVPLVYPNPVSDVLHVSLPAESDIIIFSNTGIKVFEKADVLSEAITISEFPKGIYTLIVKCKGDVSSHKILIN